MMTETRRVIDIPLAGSTLRVIHAEAEELVILAHGFGGGSEPFDRPHWCGAPLRVPLDALPALRAALARLEDSVGEVAPKKGVDHAG